MEYPYFSVYDKDDDLKVECRTLAQAKKLAGKTGYAIKWINELSNEIACNPDNFYKHNKAE